MKLNDIEHQNGKPMPKRIPIDLVELNWDGFSSIYVTLPKAEGSWIKKINAHQ